MKRVTQIAAGCCIIFAFGLSPEAQSAKLSGVADANAGKGGSAFTRSSATIRVRFSDSLDRLVLRGIDLRVYSAEKQNLLLQGSGTKSWKVSCDSRNVRMGSKTFRKGVYVESPAGFLRVESLPYRGRIWLHAGKKGCELINEVEMEKYLAGVVASEFSPKWSEQAVAAQVIAARTYALYQMGEARRAKRHYDVESTIRDQVYEGAAGEHHLASRVVEKTRGMVLTGGGAKPQPIKAFYHSTCGGRTQMPARVWGSDYPGFRRTVDCPHCTSSPKFKWNIELSEPALKKLIVSGVRETGVPSVWSKSLGSAGDVAGVEQFMRKATLMLIRPAGADPSGRISELHMTWKSDKAFVKLPIAATLFRRWVGTKEILSTAFSVLKTGSDRWNISGRGYGHGVGMCQWGAKVMGEKGFKSASILKFYYPDAQLTQMW